MRRGTPRLLLLGALALVASGCDERERTNPLDPTNDDTGGRPDWLRAVAENRAVSLSWQRAPREGFLRYVIERSVLGGPFGAVFSPEDPFVVGYRDTSVANGADLAYRLSIELQDGSRVELPEKAATPGSAIPWIVESGSFGLLRFSPDGRNLVRRSGSTSGSFDAEVEPDGAGVWAADYFGGLVRRFGPDGRTTAAIDVRSPFRIAVDVDREIVWVGSWRTGETPILFAFDFEGIERDRLLLRGEVRDLVVDPESGACFAALGRGEGIARARVGDTLLFSKSVRTIMMLTRATTPGFLVGGDPLAGGVFGYDFDTLEEIGGTDTIERPQALLFALDRLFVADGSDSVLALNATWAVTGSFAVPGIVTAMGADEETGTLWLALPTNNRVLRVGADGKERSRISLFQPFGVTIGRSEE